RNVPRARYRGARMKIQRRSFLTLLGTSAAAWPRVAPAQQDTRMRRVGILMGYAEGDPEAQVLLSALLGPLAQLGWTEGRNLRIDYRWAVGDVERMRTLARELIALQPDMIVANTTPVTGALYQETRTVPIVFVIVSDPVGAGFVASLARPGGNFTGFINVEGSFGGKWLDLLRDIA